MFHIFHNNKGVIITLEDPVHLDKQYKLLKSYYLTEHVKNAFILSGTLC